MSLLADAIDTAGLSNLARLCGPSKVAIFHWKSNGLPASEYTGQTEYWKVIQKECKKRDFPISKKDLFDSSSELRQSKS